MTVYTNTLIVFSILSYCFAKPVNQPFELEYERYMIEVHKLLTQDEKIDKIFDSVDDKDIMREKVTEHLDSMSEHIRTKLDETKRIEVERLLHLIKEKQYREGNNWDNSFYHHIDMTNGHTFEKEDLKRLMVKLDHDMHEADLLRRGEFKQYEMTKEYNRRLRLKSLTEYERAQEEKRYKEEQEVRAIHEKVHAPGHKQQLEEVWQEEDHMEEKFNEKTFFMMHDLDSNGYWDPYEVNALMILELNKIYDPKKGNYDPRRREEEMERMRETVYVDIDKNKDGLIHMEEFMDYAKSANFEKDDDWEDLDKNKSYTDEELNTFIKEKEVQPEVISQATSAKQEQKLQINGTVNENGTNYKV